MLGAKFKDPAAVKPVFIDWSDYILASHPSLAEDDKISDSTWSMPARLVNEAASFSDTLTWITLSGGTLGVKHDHECRSARVGNDRRAVVPTEHPEPVTLTSPCHFGSEFALALLFETLEREVWVRVSDGVVD